MTELKRKAMIEAIDDIWWDSKRCWRKYENLRYYNEHDFERMELDSGSPGTNSVFNSHINSENPQARIKEVVAQYMNRSDVMSWWVGACCSPDNIGETLIELGFNAHELYGMALNLNTWQPGILNTLDLEIKHVSENSELSEFIDVWVDALGDTDAARRMLFNFYGNEGSGPESRYVYLYGLKEEEMIATSAIRYFDLDCLITFIACKEGFRKNGYGSIMTKAVLTEAKKRGSRYAILHATEAGSTIYRKIGFKDYNKSVIYILKKENYKPE